MRRHHGLQHVCGQTSGGAVQDHVPGKTSERVSDLLTNQMCLFIKHPLFVPEWGHLVLQQLDCADEKASIKESSPAHVQVHISM